MNIFKIKTVLLAVVAAITMISCSGDQGDRMKAPENLIPKEEMVNLMVEMQILEAKFIETHAKSSMGAISDFNEAQKKLLASLNTDSAQYYTSEQYYMQDLGQYYDMISAVTDTIDSMRNALKER